MLKILGVSACFAMAAVTAKAEEVSSGKENDTQKAAEPGTIEQHHLHEQHLVLSCKTDTYGGVSIEHSDLPSSPVEFAKRLEASLALWAAQGKRGIWLTIPEKQADLVPVAVKIG